MNDIRAVAEMVISKICAPDHEDLATYASPAAVRDRAVAVLLADHQDLLAEALDQAEAAWPRVVWAAQGRAAQSLYEQHYEIILDAVMRAEREHGDQPT